MRKQWFMVDFGAARTKALRPLYEALRARRLATTEAALILGTSPAAAGYASAGSDLNSTRQGLRWPLAESKQSEE